MTSETIPPLSGYLQKLERRYSLPEEQRRALLSIPADIHTYNNRQQILKEGQCANRCVFLIEGLVTRQKLITNKMQIISISLPGDAIDMQNLFFADTDASLVAHANTSIASVDQADIILLIEANTLLAKLLWHDTLVDSSMFREWAMNIAHRRASDRIGFLFLEIDARMAAIGRTGSRGFEMPLTQQDLASALGLSLVHMNKSLAKLRAMGLVELDGRSIHLADRAALAHLVGFDPSYLQISTTPTLTKLTHSLSPSVHLV